VESFNFSLKPKGQALIETVLVLPLLLLLLAGVIQLTILIQARIAFDKTCGDVAREYNAGLVSQKNEIGPEIWKNLGTYQKYFDQSSLTFTTQTPQPTAIDSLLHLLDNLGPWGTAVRAHFTNYGGQTWTININCMPPYTITLLFPHGIPLQTKLTILRYPI
jgi:hypothetical protein